MIKKLDNLDYESIEKISNIWLNSNLEAHDFIKREYWISNFDKVKKMFPDSSIHVYYAGIDLSDLLAYMSNILQVFLLQTITVIEV
ncbi:hypothetical protein ACV566_03775 [Staphylococcus aureus]